LARTPRPVALAPKKPAGTRRVFVFGESAAYGDPDPAFGMPRYLEVLLKNRYPGTEFEVVNVAMTAINSNVLLPIARDCEAQDGDFWILYIGNNEVIGPFGGGTVFGPQAPSLGFIRANIALRATRVGQMLDSLMGRLSSRTLPRGATVGLDLFLDHKLAEDDPRMEKIYSHFAKNLADIMKAGTHSGARVIVSTVASNLKDCPPFVSLHRRDLSETEHSKWDLFFQAGIQADLGGDVPGALRNYEDAARIDDRFAELHFREAHNLWLSGDYESARKHYERARDLDALRVRADSRINEIIRQVANSAPSAERVRFVDGNETLAKVCAHGIAGEEVLYEHVHLNFKGNYLLARAIAEQMDPLMAGTSTTNNQSNVNRWLSEEEASLRLGLNDWDRWNICELLCKRLSAPPFTAQLNHGEQYERMKAEAARYHAAVERDDGASVLEACRQAIALSPADWVLHRRFAEMLAKRGERISAIEEWKKVAESLPHDATAACELGLLYEETGQIERCLGQLRLAVELNPYSAEALSALGHTLAKNGEFAEALRLCQRALRVEPDLASARINLGVALAGLGRKEEAKTQFEEALRIAPDDTEAALQLGQLLNDPGQVNDSLKRYAEALRSNPSDATLHEKMGETLELLGRFDEAGTRYAEAVRLKPDFSEAYLQLGLIRARQGQVAEVITYLSEAVRLDPGSYAAHLNLGIALAKQQKFEQAAAQFQEALRLKPNDPAAQDLLSKSFRALGK
jgi:tetratricopeptide (TPR) repeat protein